MASVDVGVPHCSLVSPLLFVIYIAPLHPNPSLGITLSYVDDISLTVASPSYRRNVQCLQALAGTLLGKADRSGLSFSLPKTELMHWQTPHDRSPPCRLPVNLNGSLFFPSAELRWLGYWLTPKINPFNHFMRRLTLARTTFQVVRRLSHAGKGLTPLHNRRLALAMIFPILTYGSDIFVPPKKAS